MPESLQPTITIDRCGVVLERDHSDPREAEGVLNPAVAGNYLLYRAVSKGNYSRIMAAELMPPLSDKTCARAQRLGVVVLEPQTPYELSPTGRGGIEDPRVTELSDGVYVMFYTGYGRPKGFTRQTPVVAVAVSSDGLHWERLGRVTFAPHEINGQPVDFNLIPNKDTVLFSEKINGRYAMLHRPMFTYLQAKQLGVPRRAIWYAEADGLTGPWDNHRLVLSPQYTWEHHGVGAGVPPIRLQDMWVHIYHGFHGPEKHGRKYSVGVFLTPYDKPTDVAYRSDTALLEPKMTEEMVGIVSHVVFPTAVWEDEQVVDNDLTLFWGGADARILAGVLHLPSVVLNRWVRKNPQDNVKS